jgi:20S proteasome alpha/beta subunit
VTVGIAAICRMGDSPFIVGAADRMLTAGDIEFEHPEPKVVPLASRIVALFAGDVTAHMSICRAARAQITRSHVLDVATAAEIVGAAFRDYRGRVAEQKVLTPIGLTLDSFFARQRDLTDELATQVTRALADQSAGVETIVTGMDEHGGHVFLIADPGQVTCYDGIGFAAIGNGSRHAASHLLQLGYTPRVPFPRAAVLVHVAKKRAEVAPGVGPTTDAFGIGDRYYFPVSDEFSARLTAICGRIREQESAILESAVAEFADYVRIRVVGPACLGAASRGGGAGGHAQTGKASERGAPAAEKRPRSG